MGSKESRSQATRSPINGPFSNQQTWCYNWSPRHFWFVVKSWSVMPTIWGTSSCSHVVEQCQAASSYLIVVREVNLCEGLSSMSVGLIRLIGLTPGRSQQGPSLDILEILTMKPSQSLRNHLQSTDEIALRGPCSSWPSSSSEICSSGPINRI